MVTISLTLILEYFFTYSFLGWCTEVAYQAVKKGQVINRGFLNGPVCPIYGFGVLGVFGLLWMAGDGNFQDENAFIVFIFGVVLATSVELFGGWIMDKMFHARWWDYSGMPFNLHGYICLEFSLIWGLGILLVVKVFNPMIANLLEKIPHKIGLVAVIILSLLITADFIVSVMVMVGLNKRLAEIDEMREKMRVVSNGLSERIGTRALETAQHVGEARVQVSLARDELAEKRRTLAERLRRSRHFGAGRLLRAFPDMKHRDYEELLQSLRSELRPPMG